MKDKTRRACDELGHIYVKDALEHALRMKYALMAIKSFAEQSNIPELVKLCDDAIKG